MYKHFYTGIKLATRLWRIGLIVYLIQLLLAIPFGLQVHEVIDASMGNSWELERLLLGYDHTVYSDFLNKHGASISPLLGQLRWLILVYLIISVFIQAGILYCIYRKKYQWTSFWHGGSAFFIPFLKIALVYLLVFLLWSALIWLPVLSISQNAMDILPTEKTFLLILLVSLIIYILGLLFLFNASLSSRLSYLKYKISWHLAFRKGIAWATRNYLKHTSLVLMYGFTLVLVTIIYLIIENNPGMISAFWVVVFLIIQQLFIFFRIFWRIATMSGIHLFYLETQQ